MAVSLGYNGAEVRGIQNNPNAFYRAHGAAGWQDWLDSGKIRNNPTGGYANTPAYWSKGAPLGKYAQRSGGTHIIESLSPKISSQAGSFPRGDLGKYNAFKVYAAQGRGLPYEMIYHNQPWKQLAKTAGRSALGTVGMSIATDMAFPDVANAYTPQEEATLQRARNAYGAYGASGSW